MERQNAKKISERELVAQRVASALGAQLWGSATEHVGCRELPLKTVDYKSTPRRLNMVCLRVTFYEGFGLNVTVRFRQEGEDLICTGEGTVLSHTMGQNPGGYGGASRTYKLRPSGALVRMN